MTAQPPVPLESSRTGGRRCPGGLGDECRYYDEPGWFDGSTDAVQQLHPGRAEHDGRTVQPGGHCVIDGWDDLGPEAA